ncbi:MAG: ATPase [Thermobacillus sp. ZCTH02-B1]|uniref:AAA family ATPase n=1 Tax=Thermobacillus sp. ZCTH02-B1 TaxID=1858795 RepID=UPI000B577FEB|nr:ATP-binding protein [Thermobacillus sp. ZCTH02-B1]OUM97405.1 MAG: ATPase [Thermobacillus sp. ZCTH02-B1]
MINKVKLRNFGPLRNVDWNNLGKINLIIGENGTGKSFLLKSMYSAMRTIEEFGRGNDRRSVNEVLSEKLYWTFQVEKIGDLVAKSYNEPLTCEIVFEGNGFSYKFGKDTTRTVTVVDNKVSRRKEDSLFLPAKEVLSIFHLVIESREKDRVFGFDDTYYDLVRALMIPKKQGKNYTEFAAARRELDRILGGKAIFDENLKKWMFKKGNQKFSIGVTAEGSKKLSILDTLLGNRSLTPGSVMFIDEPDVALHPKAISSFMDIIFLLAQGGIQFFLASHSYFVIKKLHLIAMKNRISIPVISLNADPEREPDYDDLLFGMPANSIIDESIRLYEEEMDGILR